MVLDRVYIELIGREICVVTVFNLGTKGAFCYSHPKAGILHLGPAHEPSETVGDMRYMYDLLGMRSTVYQTLRGVLSSRQFKNSFL